MRKDCIAALAKNERAMLHEQWSTGEEIDGTRDSNH